MLNEATIVEAVDCGKATRPPFFRRRIVAKLLHTHSQCSGIVSVLRGCCSNIVVERESHATT
jgi:hypothetical protein